MKESGYESEAESKRLDAVFSALADPTRRAILRRLTQGPAPVKSLAEPFDMSQPAVSRHLKVLETAGLVTRDVQRQTRPATLQAQPLADAQAWITDFEAFWTTSFDRLDALLVDLQTQDKDDPK